jgi:hypothetical protein
MAGYSPRENMPIIFFVLLIVVAFDLAIQPWVGVNLWFLLVMPALLACSGLIVKFTIIDQVSYLTSKQFDRIRLAVLFAGVYLIGCLVLLLGRAVFWSDFSMDFFVVVGLLWVSAELFRSDVWEDKNETHGRRRRRLYTLVGGAVICFAFEGSVVAILYGPDGRCRG